MSDDGLRLLQAMAREALQEFARDTDLLSVVEMFGVDEEDGNRILNLIQVVRVLVNWDE